MISSRGYAPIQPRISVSCTNNKNHTFPDGTHTRMSAGCQKNKSQLNSIFASEAERAYTEKSLLAPPLCSRFPFRVVLLCPAFIFSFLFVLLPSSLARLLCGVVLLGLLCLIACACSSCGRRLDTRRLWDLQGHDQDFSSIRGGCPAVLVDLLCLLACSPCGRRLCRSLWRMQDDSRWRSSSLRNFSCLQVDI